MDFPGSFVFLFVILFYRFVDGFVFLTDVVVVVLRVARGFFVADIICIAVSIAF